MREGEAHPDPPTGVFVLGMHRSGTSVVAGVLERLGLEAGDRRSMLAPDQFNADGYWEQRPVVEWHNEVLARLGGWPSAPPVLPAPHVLDELAGEFEPLVRQMLQDLYGSPWFMKDPRQCLLLGLWRSLRGSSELAVVVSRSPAEVIRSLQRRNAYSFALASALWERYSRDLLEGLAGRPCLFLRYEDLTADPQPTIAAVSQAVERHVGVGCHRTDRVSHAASLVRTARRPASPAIIARLSDEQVRLNDLLESLTGYHARFEVPSSLPDPTPGSAEVIRRRRARLNRIRPLLRTSSDLRASMDKVPGLLRRGRGGVERVQTPG